jgi:hypothetical protein
VNFRIGVCILLVLLGLTALGLLGRDGSSAVGAAAPSDQYEYKAVLCHRTSSGKSVTISPGNPAVQAHLAHGDTVGPCPSG